jgi:hypothetical protein
MLARDAKRARRLANGRKRWLRWRARERAGIAVVRVQYNAQALSRLILAGFLPNKDTFTEEEISRAISDLIQHDLPHR